MLFQEVMLATHFWQRMRGLLFRKPLAYDQALLIKPCASIHCIGMTYAIDVVFLNEQYEIIKCVACVEPMALAHCSKANMTLEMQQGIIKQLKLKVGDVLQWKSN